MSNLDSPTGMPEQSNAEFDIMLSASGRFIYTAPVQQWDGDAVMQVAMFAGQQMMVNQASDDDQATYELRYLGFKTAGFEQMASAKAAAPAFAREVLSILSKMIVDHPGQA